MRIGKLYLNGTQISLNQYFSYRLFVTIMTTKNSDYKDAFESIFTASLNILNQLFLAMFRNRVL